MASFPVPYWGFLHRILLIFFLLFSTVFLISIFICLILNFSTLPIIFKLQFLVWAQPHSPVCMVMFIESSRSICFRFAFDGVNFEFTVCLQRNVLTGCSRGVCLLVPVSSFHTGQQLLFLVHFSRQNEGPKSCCVSVKGGKELQHVSDTTELLLVRRNGPYQAILLWGFFKYLDLGNTEWDHVLRNPDFGPWS